MATIGAQLVSVTPGEVTIDLPFRADLTQQHGFLHAGVVTAVIDNACGYAALTLLPTGAAVLAVEFKVNLLAPASGASFRATGRVVRSGRTLTVCTGELRSGDTLIAIMQTTVFGVARRDALRD
jgi:uncharacterized protein (TIGR00369 family)